MATDVTLRLQFDPELPLFSTKVKGHTIEVYFSGHMLKKKMWTVFVDADDFEFPTLAAAFLGIQEVVKHRFGKEIELYFPTEDT